LLALSQELDRHGLLATPANPNPRMFEWSDLGKLTYLNAVIKEVLRVCSPVALGSIRVATDDIVVDDLFLPKGVWLIFPQ
jgi:cytochrome P450